MRWFTPTRILALALILATAGYMAAVAPSLPDRLPMQWDLEGRPTWHSDKAGFFGFNVFGLLIAGSTALFMPIPEPRMIGCAALAGLLAVFHAQVEQILRPTDPGLSVNAAVVLLFALLLGTIAVAVPRALRRRKAVWNPATLISKQRVQ